VFLMVYKPIKLKIITCVIMCFFAFALRPIPSFSSTLLDDNLNINQNTIWHAGTFLANKITVEPGAVLTIGHGVTIKFKDGGELNVYGTLRVMGEASSKVTMEPRDGSLVGWNGIKFLPESASFMDNGLGSIVKYAVITSASVGIECKNSSPKINACLIKDSISYGIYLHNSSLEISQNKFVNNRVNLFCDAGSSPVILQNIFDSSSVYLAEVAPDIVEKIVRSGQSFYVDEESSVRSVIKILRGSITKTPNWPAFLPGSANIYKFTYYISGDLHIAKNASLNIDAGGSFELAEGKNITVAGSFSAIGSETNNIVFTTANMKPITHWGKVHLLATSKDSEFIFCNFLYGGSKEAAVVVESSSSVIKNSHIGHSAHVGIYSDSIVTTTEIENNIISDGESFPFAAREPMLNKLHSKNTFHNNKFNNSFIMLPSLINSPTIWDKSGYTRVLLGVSTIAENTTLSIKPGVIVKFLASSGLNVDGTLKADGSSEKIVFTSAKDTKYGDKAAIDGSSPIGGDWLGISFNSVNGSMVKNCRVTYGNGILVKKSNVTISGCTISYNKNSGIMCDAASTPIIIGNNITNNNGYNIGVPIQLHESTITENTFEDNAINALYISGGIANDDVVWERYKTYDERKFFYVIGGNIRIRGKLSIKKNVLLKLENSSITCMGGVEIIGEANSNITLTSTEDAPSANDWGGIILSGKNVTNIIKYCNIQYGSTALSCLNGQVTLENVSLENNSTAVEALSGTRAVLAGVNICSNGVGLYLKESSGFIFNSLFRNNITSGAVYAYNSLINIRNTIISENTFGIKLDSPTGGESVSYCNIYNNKNGNFIIDDTYADTAKYGSGNISEETKFKSDACDALWDDTSPCYGAGELKTTIGYKFPAPSISVSSEFSTYEYAKDVVLTTKTDQKSLQSKYIAYVISPNDNVYVIEMSNTPTGIVGTFNAEDSSPKGRYTLIGIVKEEKTVSVDTAELDINTTWEGIPPTASFAAKLSTTGAFSLDASASSNADGTYENLTYNWNLGDGTYRGGKIVLYQYKAGGKYEIELTVTDKFGKNNTSVQVITVPEPSAEKHPNIDDVGRSRPERINGQLVSLVRVVIFDENKNVESVTIDLADWSLPPVLMYDDGTNGDMVKGDNIYYAFIEIPNSIEPKEYSIPITVVDATGLKDKGYVKYNIDQNLLGNASNGTPGNDTRQASDAPLLSPVGNILLFAAFFLAWLKVGQKSLFNI